MKKNIRSLLAAIVAGLLLSATIATAGPDEGKKGGGAAKGKMFDRIDADGDGSLSKSEFVAFRVDTSKKRFEKQGLGEDEIAEKLAGIEKRMGKAFATADSDGDGLLAKKEFGQMQQKSKRKKSDS